MRQRRFHDRLTDERIEELQRLLAEYESAVDASEDSGELDDLAAVMDATDALGSAAGRALPALLAERETLREDLTEAEEWIEQPAYRRLSTRSALTEGASDA